MHASQSLDKSSELVLPDPFHTISYQGRGVFLVRVAGHYAPRQSAWAELTGGRDPVAR
jgi:hypothetical protein